MSPALSSASLLLLLARAEAFAPAALCAAPRAGAARRAAVCATESPPPSGFSWAEGEAPDSAAAAPAAPAAPAAAAAVEDSPIAAAPAPISEAATETIASADAADTTTGKVVPAKIFPVYSEPWSEGIFAPLVRGAKYAMGEQELKELRASVIAKHSKVIANFVDTSESQFGQLVLKRMFEYADKDGNGTLDKEEVKEALKDLGFDFLDQKQVDTIMKKADKDKNAVIDFEEFVKETPKVLRVNLVKLAKQNGHDLGFLV